MISVLFAIKVVMGQFEFENVPRLLKDAVKLELENMGMGHLAK